MSLSSTLPLKTIGCSALRCTCTFGAPASEEGEKLSPENVIFESWSGVSGGLAVTFMAKVQPALPLRSRRAPKARRSTTAATDRKSTRLNSSHQSTPYADFCFKKKHKKKNKQQQ